MRPELASEAHGAMMVTARGTAMRWPLTSVPRKDWHFFPLFGPFRSHKQGHFFSHSKDTRYRKIKDTGARKCQDKGSHLLEVKHGWARPEQVRIRFSRRKTLPTPMYLLLKLSGLPWWHSGRESACPCRGHGFEPWSGKIPHAAEQLSP